MRTKTEVLFHGAAIALGLVAAACSLTGLPGNQNDNGLGVDQSFKLVAQANSGTLESEVAYSESGNESSFEINISGGVPGSQIDIVVNSVVVASIVLDDAGSAHVKYSSSPDDSGGLHLPDAFVAPQAGDSVAVGDLQSTFEEDSSDDDEDSNDNTDGNENDNDDDSANNTNDNENDNGDDDSVDNDNDGTDDNVNDNSTDNDNSNDTGNDNSDDNGNDNAEDGDNDSGDDSGNVNGNTNDNDSGNDNDR